MKRTKTISRLADLIACISLPHPLRVGIDGVGCAGKTMLADELIEPLRARGRSVIRASIDGFHNPREIRHQQGRDCPKGYYEDSFDLEAVLSCVLLPLGPNGTGRYKAAQFDFRTDEAVDGPWSEARRDSVLVFEGVFLHRPELMPHWDYTVFVDTGCDTAMERAFVRDQDLFGSREETRERYQKRYIPGQALYREHSRPTENANVIVKNDDIQNPDIVVGRPPRSQYYGVEGQR